MSNSEGFSDNSSTPRARSPSTKSIATGAPHPTTPCSISSTEASKLALATTPQSTNENGPSLDPNLEKRAIIQLDRDLKNPKIVLTQLELLYKVTTGNGVKFVSRTKWSGVE